MLTNKYSEGYPHKRYYEGQRHVPTPWRSCARAASKPSSRPITSTSSPTPGAPPTSPCTWPSPSRARTIMGLGLPAGGHLTHGWNVSITGKFFKSVAYGVRRGDERIDMDQVRALALEHRPKLLWCGATAYPRTIDFAAFRSIADEVGAILAADMAHIAGLVMPAARLPLARGHRRRRHVHHPQDAARPAWRVHPEQGRARQGHRQGGLPRPPGRPPRSHHRGHRRGRARGGGALVQSLRRRRRRQRPGPRRGARRARLPALHRRHRQPPPAHRHDAQGRGRPSPTPRPSSAPASVANYNSIPFDPRKPFDPSRGPPRRMPAVTSRGMGVAEMGRLAGWMDEVAQHPGDEERPRRASPPR